MKWAIIGTWEMAKEGIEEGASLLNNGEVAGSAIEEAIKMVEDNPNYTSVGYGGLPNEQGVVELDAAYMDGDTLDIGSVAGIRDFKNPISIAKKLSKERFNCFLVGLGAEEYAQKYSFERVNMLTEKAKAQFEKRVKETFEKGLSPYDGHDTVGVIALDMNKTMAVGTSTSGLFMKKRGRIGDSPIPGAGFYVNSEIGGAAATGLGEDLMKGSISYEIVRLMEEGFHPQEAADKAVLDLHNSLIKKRGKSGDLSVICLNNKGEFGASSNIDDFYFVVATEEHESKVYKCKNIKSK